MSAMMLTHNMTSRASFSKVGAEARKLHSKVHRAPFVAGQAKQRRTVVMSAHANKVQAASVAYP